MADLLSLIGELAGQTTLIDSMVLKISSVSISPFFVENIQKIQLSAIKCATVLFSKYGDHRRHLLDDILSSLARLPTTKVGFSLNIPHSTIVLAKLEELPSISPAR